MMSFPANSAFHNQFYIASVPSASGVAPVLDMKSPQEDDGGTIGIERHVLEDWVIELRDAAESGTHRQARREQTSYGWAQVLADEIDGYLERP